MSKFYIWIDKNVNANTLDEASFQTACENGFQAGQPARALEANSAIRQANLIAVALMQSLGLVDKANLQSSVTDVANLFSNTELFKLTNVFGSNGKVKISLWPNALGMSIGSPITNGQFDGYFRYVSVKALDDVITFVGKQISDIFVAPTKNTNASVIAAQTLTAADTWGGSTKVKANSAIVAVTDNATTARIMPVTKNCSFGSIAKTFTSVHLGSSTNESCKFDSIHVKKAYIDGQFIKDAHLDGSTIVYNGLLSGFNKKLDAGIYLLYPFSDINPSGPNHTYVYLTTCIMIVNGTINNGEFSSMFWHGTVNKNAVYKYYNSTLSIVSADIAHDNLGNPGSFNKVYIQKLFSI